MGKALGNTLDPEALVGGYGPDAVRLFFMKEVAFGQDGNFSEAAFRDVVNACLANAVGNMLNRTLGLLRKNCAGQLPEGASAAAAALLQTAEEGSSSSSSGMHHPLQQACADAVAAAADAYGRAAPHAAIDALLGIAAAGNLYLEQTAPWTAFKKGSDAEREAAGRVLVVVLEASRILAVALSPVTPALSARVYAQLGLGGEPLEGRVTWAADTAWGGLTAGTQTADPAPVFARIDDTVQYVTEPAPSAATAAAGSSGSSKKQQQPQQQPKKAKAKAAPSAAPAAAAAAPAAAT